MPEELKQIQADLAPVMNRIADVLDTAFKGNGFALFIFPLNTPDGRTNYISNVNRPEMLKVLDEFTKKHADQPYDGVMPKAED